MFVDMDTGGTHHFSTQDDILSVCSAVSLLFDIYFVLFFLSIVVPGNQSHNLLTPETTATRTVVKLNR